MSEILDRYRSIATTFGARIAGVTAGQWDAATPCSEWTVRDLVTHVVNTNRRILANATGEAAVEPDPTGDLGVQYAEATGAILDALGNPDLAGKTVGGMFGEQSFEQLVSRLGCADLLLHTWDLARATGQDETLDAHACEVALEFLTPLDEGIRRPGGFSPKLDAPADATVQARLLAFCGRAL